MDIYIALVHHPVLNRLGETVSTAVTNLDIHDLARAARTYDVRGTFIVTPIEQQRSLVRRIVDHWQGGEGATFNPIRAQAFDRVHVTADLEKTVAHITLDQGGYRPRVCATGAKLEGTVPTEELRRQLAEEEGSLLCCFGTGWGLAPAALDHCDLALPALHAVQARAGYNHLSVRSAVSIYLDRLLGAR